MSDKQDVLTTVRCLLGRKTLTIGFCGDLGLIRERSEGFCSTDKDEGAKDREEGTEDKVISEERDDEESVPFPNDSSNCCSLCWRASSLLVYSS